MLNIILVAFEIIFYSFHISVFILLFVKRHTTFDGAFYSIFRAILFADVACYISHWGATRMLQIKLFPLSFFQSSDIASSIIYTLTSFFVTVQFVGHALLSINRFTLLWFPLQQKVLWSKPWYIVPLIGIPILHHCYRAHTPGIFVLLADDMTKVAIADPDLNSLHYKMAFSIYSVLTAIAAICNILAIWKIILHKQYSSTFNANDKSLLFVSLITFCVQIIRIIYVIFTDIFANNKEVLSIIIIASPYVYDIFGICGSITLMILSKTTRQAYMSFYNLKWKKSINTTVAVISTSSPKIT